ncbi:MAG: Asp-tRNA(Asn)/Glu-tRNA(Gln) amidotransferase subunit GatC [Clostridia bacterium]|jgi:aspartyl-tRNA(Asn)/glutamyl-tRNA(Gln) amidotransferase subunit C|nr:Asp-tRNA(Asn)/Glu-tRNA(Gln) amidotransferase subunit GatC [Clostridia bacterium]
MKITHDEIRHIARLARIEIPEDQFDKLAQDMENIVDMVAQLQQVDLSDMELNLSAQCNIFREDEPMPSMPREAVLQNAPAKEAGCVLVPRVMEE